MLGQQLPSSEGQWQMVADNPDSMPERTGWKLPRPTGFTSASSTSQSEARLDKHFPFQSQSPAWHTLRPSMSHNQERYLLMLISKYRSRLDYISLDITVPLVPTLTTTCHLTTCRPGPASLLQQQRACSANLQASPLQLCVSFLSAEGACGSSPVSVSAPDTPAFPLQAPGSSVHSSKL